MTQVSLNPKTGLLGQKVCPVAHSQTDRQSEYWRTLFQGFRTFSFDLSSRIGPAILNTWIDQIEPTSPTQCYSPCLNYCCSISNVQLRILQILAGFSTENLATVSQSYIGAYCWFIWNHSHFLSNLKNMFQWHICHFNCISVLYQLIRTTRVVKSCPPCLFDFYYHLILYHINTPYLKIEALSMCAWLKYHTMLVEISLSYTLGRANTEV